MSVKVGDVICLFSEEKSGFVFSLQSNRDQNSVAVQPHLNREDPDIPDPNVVRWKILVHSRYKLDKKYRKLKERITGKSWNDPKIVEHITKAKGFAEAECRDNNEEQDKHEGTVLTYGQTIQLHNVFADKYLHISTTTPAKLDKSCMKVELHPFNAKAAQFRVMPMYKVKVEGDPVAYDDPVILESLKYPGQFLHVSDSMFPKATVYTDCHEVNLTTTPSNLILRKSYSPSADQQHLLKGGDTIRLFHKEIEAYLCAEGMFGTRAEVTVDAHFRVRKIDLNEPKTVFPSTSAIVYWQLESSACSYSGEELCWAQNVRLKHVVTRHYLKVLSDHRSSVTQDKDDPYTTFKLHPVTESQDRIHKESFCRIEHAMTGTWLHAKQEETQRLKDSVKRKRALGSFDLVWTSAPQRKLGLSTEMQFADVFAIQAVQGEDLDNYRFIAGQLPELQSLNEMVLIDPEHVSHHQREILTMLKDLKSFMMVDGVPCKKRQKLLRNFQIVDQLVEFLRLLSEGPQQRSPSNILSEIYNVIRVYCLGSSRKNELYIARHQDFFLLRTSDEGNQNVHAAQMLMELIQDNIEIIKRITHQHIRGFVKLLKRRKDYRYLELLGVLCVCEGEAIAENQRYITDNWLIREAKEENLSHEQAVSPRERCIPSKKLNRCVFHTTLGQGIGRDINILFVSKDNRKTWTSIYDIIKAASLGQTSDLRFLEHQLDLFYKLCYGANTYATDMITDELKHITWEEAFSCLTDPNLTTEIRAKYCRIIEVAFVTSEDVAANIDQLRMIYIYHEARDIGKPAIQQGDDDGLETLSLVKRRVQQLHQWIVRYLSSQRVMVANQPQSNLLIGQVLGLVRHMVRLGYYSESEPMKALLHPLLQLVDGRNDVPFDISQEEADDNAEVKQYRERERFTPSPDTKALVDAKLCGLEIIELFFNLRFNTRLEAFVAEFKRLHERFHQTETEAERDRQMGIVLNLDNNGEKEQTEDDLLTKLFTGADADFVADEEQRKVCLRHLTHLFQASAFFKGFAIDTVLMDLCRYDHNIIVQKAMMLLNRIFSAHDILFSKAVQAQILVTDRSCEVFGNVKNMLPVLRRLSVARLEESQIDILDQFLDVLIEYCSLEADETSPHPINQRIIYNQGILDDLLAILMQDPGEEDTGQNLRGVRQVQRKVWRLVAVLARENPTVQLRLFDRLDVLLDTRGTESSMALALIEVFYGNKLTCMKIEVTQVQKIMQLAVRHKKRCPELFQLLKSIVKFEQLDIPYRRNQENVIKCFTQMRTEVAGALDKSAVDRLAVFREGRSASTQYLSGLVDLLASCSERGPSYIESLCQGVLGVSELLDLLTDAQIADHVRRPLLRFFHFVYFRSSAHEGQEILEHMADKRLWGFLLQVRKTFLALTNHAEKRKEEVRDLMKKNIGQMVWCEAVEPQTIDSILCDTALDDEHRDTLPDLLSIHRAFYYVMDAVLPFLQTFYSCSYVKKGRRSKRESEVAHYLALSLQAFVDAVAPLLTRPEDMKVLKTAHRALLSATRVPLHMMEALQARCGLSGKALHKANPKRQYESYYKVEIDINQYFDTFAKSYQTLYQGENTVKAQLGEESNNEYTTLGSDDELPLGKEFQSFSSRFIRPKESDVTERYKPAINLIRQLGLSERQQITSEASRQAQKALDVRCLQVLRALLHNQIVLRDSNEIPPISAKTKRQLADIHKLQEHLVKLGAIETCVKNLNMGDDDVIREVFCFLSVMLYDGNRMVQEALYKSFISTRQERFFITIRRCLNLSMQGFRERRLMQNQHGALVDETVTQVKHLKQLVRTGSLGRTDFATEVNSTVLRTSESLRAVELEMSLDEAFGSRSGHSQLFGSKSTLRTSQVLMKDHLQRSALASASTAGTSVGEFKKPGLKLDRGTLASSSLTAEWFDAEEMDESQLGADLHEMVKDWIEDLPMRDEGNLSVLLKVLGRMCQGQFTKIQNYLREQPDNFRSVNLVSELTTLLAEILRSDQVRTTDIVASLLETLVELLSGNLENQTLVVDQRICDSLNVILEESSRESTPTSEVLRVQESVSWLVKALFQSQNLGRPKTRSWQRMKTSFNLSEIVTHVLNHHVIAEIVCKCYSIETGSYVNEIKAQARRVGFHYYHLLKKIGDIQGQPAYSEKCMRELESGMRAENHFAKSTMSVEIVFEGALHKIYFPSDGKGAVRKTVKNLFNYGVERDGNEHRISDFLEWSEEVMADIRHTRKLQNMVATRLVAKTEWWASITMMTLSAIIMLFIMITWKASPDDLHSPMPAYSYPWAQGLLLFLAILHYLVTVYVVIAFFITQHPRLPTVYYKLKNKYHRWKGQIDRVQPEREKYKPQHIQINLISFKTLWYILLLAFSLAGTFAQYFSVFHLLHLAEHVQLLQRAIRAVTQNGRALLLIFLFTMIFVYIFGIVNFAFYRELFKDTPGLYCSAAYECFVTVLHVGLIVSLYEGVPPADKDVPWMIHKATTDLLFFVIINAICLNMVFGVIVDTFAELRDNKWKTDQQMMAKCYICGRDSHEFETKQGCFQRHVEQEHNQWAYILFFLHLQDTRKKHHSAIEAYVRKKLERDEHDFLPLNRAICLEERYKQSKSYITLLEDRITVLVERVKELEYQQAKQEGLKQEDEWLKQYQSPEIAAKYDILSPTLNLNRPDRRVTFTDLSERDAGADTDND